MTVPRICKALGQIDEDLIAAAMPEDCLSSDPGTTAARTSAQSTRKARTVRWVLVAACLCLLTGILTVAAATGAGIRIMNIFTNRSDPSSGLQKSGFSLEADMYHFPLADFHGDVLLLQDTIREQYANIDLTSSTMPGYVKKSFDSPSDMQAFIGLDALRITPLELPCLDAQASVDGDEEGHLLYLRLESDYMDGDIGIQIFAQILTEYQTGGNMFLTSAPKEVRYTESSFTTSHGLTCQVMESTTLVSGNRMTDGYLLLDGILYSVHLRYPDASAGHASELLHQWADLLEAGPST